MDSLKFIGRQLWITMVVAVVLLALYVSLGRQLMPLVETKQLEIQDWLSSQLHIPIQMQRLRAEWHGLSPIIQVTGLQLGSQDPINVGHFSAALDLPRSLLHRLPIFTQVDVSALTANITEIAPQQWQLLGLQFDLAQPSSSDDRGMQASMDWLALQQNIQLTDIDVQLQRYAEPAERIQLSKLSWRSLINQHEFKAQLAWGAEQLANIDLQLYLEGPLWPLQQQNGRLYIKLEEQEWGHWLAALNTENFQFEELQGAMEGWLNIEQGQPSKSYLKADITRLTVRNANERFHLHQGSVLMAGQRQGEDWFARIIPDFPQALPLKEIRFNGVQVDQHQAWQLSFGEVDIGAAQALLERYRILPEHIAHFINGTAPQGTAKNARVAFYQDPQQQWQFDLKADLEHISSSSYHYIPAVTNAKAQIHVQRHAGTVTLDAAPMQVHLAELYQYPWRLSNSQGHFSWHIYSDEVLLELAGVKTLIEDKAPIIQSWPVQADVRVRLPLHSKHEPELSLLIGLPYGSVHLHPVLIPKLVGEEAEHWLAQAVLAGDISQVNFALHTELDQHKPANSSSILLALDVQQGRLNYLPGWPQLEDIQAQIKMDFPQINFDVAHTRTLGGEVTRAQARVFERGQHMELALDADIQGDSAEGIKYFTHTPLQQVVNHAFDDWQASGPLKAQLKLNYPFVAAAEPKINLSAQLSHNQLHLMAADLNLTELATELHYSSEHGVKAEHITARAFDGELALNLTSSINSHGGLDIGMQGEGQAHWAALKAWQPLSIFEPISGQLDYQLKLQVNAGRPLIQIQSDMLGSQIDYPAPLGKKPEQVRHLRLQLQPEEGLFVRAEYGSALTAEFLLQAEQLPYGQVVFGSGQASLPEQAGIEVFGHFKQPFMLEQWWQSFERLKAVTAATPAAADDVPITELIRRVDVEIMRPEGWGFKFSPILAQVKGLPEHWQIALDGKVVMGKVQLPLDERPIQVDLSKLILPKPEEVLTNPHATALIDQIIMEDLAGEEATAPAEVDPLAEIDPYSLPAVDAVIEHFSFADKDYGAWQFSSQPFKQGLKVDITAASIHAASLTGQLLWQQSAAGHSTRLANLEFSSKDLAKLQQGLGQEVAIDSKDAQAKAGLTWSGSPLLFNTESLNGEVDVKLKKGSLKNEDSAALRAFGALNLSSFSRRLKLDFSDIYQSGVAFDDWRLKAKIENGLLTLTEPMLVDGPGGKFSVSGNTDLVKKQLDMKVAVTLPVSGNLPLVAILAGLAPPVAASIYVTEKLIGDELARFTSASYTVKGSWQEPEIKLNKAFDDKVEGKKRSSFTDRVKSIFGIKKKE